jgi:hypothetical protein
MVEKRSVPARFKHDRVSVTAAAPDGETVVFYTDTGGGFNAIRHSVAERYALADRGTAAADSSEFPLVAFPEFAIDSGIPRPVPELWLGGNLAVVPDDRLSHDGFLGSRWFAGKIWEFDYPEQTLSVMNELTVPPGFEGIRLGFRTDESGDRDLNLPRITIRIDGEPLEMLLDTGATARLGESAAAAYGLPPETHVTASYIIRSTFQQWRDRHPDWTVIETGEIVTGRAFPMIEVPEVQIAGLSVGPVWFSVRPDDAFKHSMSQMMDQQIVGAVGGSMLQYLRMIIDYPGARAYFQRPGNEEDEKNGD